MARNVTIYSLKTCFANCCPSRPYGNNWHKTNVSRPFLHTSIRECERCPVELNVRQTRGECNNLSCDGRSRAVSPHTTSTWTNLVSKNIVAATLLADWLGNILGVAPYLYVFKVQCTMCWTIMSKYVNYRRHLYFLRKPTKFFAVCRSKIGCFEIHESVRASKYWSSSFHCTGVGPQWSVAGTHMSYRYTGHERDRNFRRARAYFSRWFGPIASGWQHIQPRLTLQGHSMGPLFKS